MTKANGVTDKNQPTTAPQNILMSEDVEQVPQEDTDNETPVPVHEDIEFSHEEFVFFTKNLDRLKLIDSNRHVSMDRAARIARSIRDEENRLRQYPIEITQKGYVVDGQHRLEAVRWLQERGHEIGIFFKVRDDVEHDPNAEEQTSAEKEMIAINRLSRQNWTPEDFLTHFADSGVEDYVFLQERFNEWNGQFRKNISVGALLDLANSRPKEFKEGETEVNRTEFTDRFDDLLKIGTHFPEICSKKTVQALMNIRENCPKYNVDRLVAGIRSQCNRGDEARQELEHKLKSSSITNRAMVLVKQHNKGMQKKNRISSVPMGVN